MSTDNHNATTNPEEPPGSVDGNTSHLLYLLRGSLQLGILIPMCSSCISHITTQSHWSSGSTICFPLRGAAVRALGVHPHFWNWHLLLAMSRYIGDPNLILDHRAMIGPLCLWFAMTFAADCFSHPFCPRSSLLAICDDLCRRLL